MASLAPLMPLARQPDPIHKLQTNPWAQSPLTCSVPFSKAHAALWQAWRGYSPNLRQGSAMPYIAQGCPSQSVSSNLVTVATHNSKLLA